ncbi:MAG: 2-phospho-L-lactate transferase [Anaerolineales bacterium]
MVKRVSQRRSKILALAGGVGGAKLAHGLAQLLPPPDLTIVVNTGDDFQHFGLHISPDLDTVCYTLAGLANPATGWGREAESWTVMEAVSLLGGPLWFQLGDRDLGTHLERTRRLKEGQSLSEITRCFCQAWGLLPDVLPMSDDPLSTMVHTPQGVLPFQEYFVHLRCEPQVTGFHFEGLEQARPAPGVLPAIQQASAVVVCPSNPWVSIAPILELPGLKPALQGRPVVAVSPIIAGQAVKGPAAKMYRELGIQPAAAAVAAHYGSLLDGGLLSGFVIDRQDAAQAQAIAATGLAVLVTQTLMLDPAGRRELARKVLEFVNELPAPGVVIS